MFELLALFTFSVGAIALVGCVLGCAEWVVRAWRSCVDSHDG